MNPNKCTIIVVQVIQDYNKFRRDGQIFVEYPVRARNYVEQEHFEREHANYCVIDMYWRQGAGMNLVVCGFTTQLAVLLELRHVAHLQVYIAKYPHISIGHTAVSKYHKKVTYPSSQLTWLL